MVSGGCGWRGVGSGCAGGVGRYRSSCTVRAAPGRCRRCLRTSQFLRPKTETPDRRVHAWPLRWSYPCGQLSRTRVKGPRQEAAVTSQDCKLAGWSHSPPRRQGMTSLCALRGARFGRHPTPPHNLELPQTWEFRDLVPHATVGPTRIPKLEDMWRSSRRCGEARRDVKKLEAMWRNSRRCGKARRDVKKLEQMWRNSKRCGEARGDVEKLEEMWRNPRRCEEVQGDVEKLEEMWWTVRTTSAPHSATGGNGASMPKRLFSTSERCRATWSRESVRNVATGELAGRLVGGEC